MPARGPTFRVQPWALATASVAGLGTSRFHGPREPRSRADIRPQAAGRTSPARETAAQKFRGLRPRTRRTIADMGMARTTDPNRTTVRMAHTTGRTMAAGTAVRHQVTAGQTRAITARIQATAVRSRTMAEVIAARLRPTAARLQTMAADTAVRHRVMTAAQSDAQCLLTVAVPTGAQLRPMEAVAVRWGPTAAEVGRHPTAEAEVVPVASEVAVADPTAAGVTLPRPVVAVATAVVEAVVVTDAGKFHGKFERAQNTPSGFGRRSLCCTSTHCSPRRHRDTEKAHLEPVCRAVTTVKRWCMRTTPQCSPCLCASVVRDSGSVALFRRWRQVGCVDLQSCRSRR